MEKIYSFIEMTLRLKSLLKDENSSIQLDDIFPESVHIKNEIISEEELEVCALYLEPKLADECLKINNGHKFVECSLCFKHLKESSLRQHMKTHIGLKPYQCTVCKSRFTRKGDVTRHTATMHSIDSPKFKCHSCSKWFFDKQTYSIHLKVHEKRYFYSCECCHSKFAKREYYLDHVQYGNCYRKAEKLVVSNIYDSDFLHLMIDELPDNNLPTDITVQSTSVPGKHTADNHGNIFKHDNSTTLNINCNDSGFTSNSISKIIISPVKMKSSDREQVAKAIKTVVHQSEEIIKRIQQSIGSNMTTLENSHKLDYANSVFSKSSSKLHVKAVIDGKIQKFSIELPSGVTFDAATPMGMKAILHLVSNLCSEKGNIEGEIDVKIIKELS